MKKLLLGLGLISTVCSAQVTTSVQDGDFWALSTWDCFCFPQDGDSLVINHNVSLSFGIAYTMGQIHISSTGNLDQGGNTFSFYINGGSLINDGTLTIDNLLLDAGWINNTGTANLDSVWTRSTTTNTGTINTDAFAHDENATFTNNGVLDVTNNFANQGLFINGGVMTIGGNASNCNIQSADAILDNDGFWCVAGTFLNCGGDTLRGDGTIYIGGASTNDGEVLENLLIHTPGGAFSFNSGNVAGTVTFGTDGCAAGIEEDEIDEDEMDWILFPNPATTIIQSTEKNVKYSIYDLSGKLVLSGVSFNGTIHIDNLDEGNYIINLENEKHQSTQKSFIKL